MNKDLFINSTRVLVQNWELILAILVCVSWGTLLTFATLKKITRTQFSDAELNALALGGWPLPALVISALILALHFFIPDKFISVISVCCSRCMETHFTWFHDPFFYFPVLCFHSFGIFRQCSFATLL
jgi:CHASE2 domain-containing sensor protein